MTVLVRFAPSPTGNIHIGNARTALFNWLFAQKAGGRFILRFDDTDVARSRREYADNIERDLAWLGIRPAEVHRQSERLSHYDAAAERLITAGLLYPCYETQEELELRRKVRLSRKLPPVYGREALKLTDEERARFEAEGRKPHWRFLLPNFDGDPHSSHRTEIRWDDLCRGPQVVDLASISDPVLVRADGSYLYTFTSVVDDVEMGISHIIRGEDHITNTGVQTAIFRGLDAEPPLFGHHNLLTTASGEGLSKRTGSLSLQSLRNDGIEPMAVASLAVLTGTSENVQAAASLAELAEGFELSAASKGAAKFDPVDLLHLNRVLIQARPYKAVSAELAAMGITGVQAEPFWLSVRGNLDRPADAKAWWEIVTVKPAADERPGDEDRGFLREAASLLPPEPWDQTAWKTWTDAIKTATGRKGKTLFMPLRVALTGRSSGPEIADLMPLLGRAEIAARLS